MGKRVILHNTAITDHGKPIHMGNCVFRDRKTSLGGHAHCGPWGQWGEGFMLPVPSKRFEAILTDTNTKRIALLKMDCEGCECDVLKDIRNMTVPVEISTAVGECHTLSKSHVPVEERERCRSECGKLMDKSVFLKSTKDNLAES